MRTLAIGDIHGCFRALKTLESFANFSRNDKIVTLGDHIDRGPDSCRVIEWLIEREGRGLVSLKGNHELMMLAAKSSSDHKREWLACGGQAVLDSYRVRRVQDIPKDHLDFISNRLRRHHVSGDYIFVHANAYPDLDLDEQPDYMLFWESSTDRAPHESGKTIICGHTPQRNGLPLDLGHAICIDTAACRSGWLTCLDVKARYCWQANQDGDTRSFYLDDVHDGVFLDTPSARS